MAYEERIQYMLRAAARAEGQGDGKTARLFRRMAQDARPVADSADAQLPAGLKEFDF